MNTDRKVLNAPDCGPACRCGSGGLDRRRFLRLSMISAAGAASGAWPLGAIAGPFDLPIRNDDFPIPAAKKFAREWIESLTSRGSPTAYRTGELDFIGMPIGGICAGQVYLGGDGSLWHWDIFNLPQSSEWSHSSGPLYAAPARRASPIAQGFGVRVRSGADVQDRRLDASGFRDIEFRGQYPIGLVRFSDAAAPLRVELEAFSPFVPLDEDTSGTPAIVMRYTFTNTGDAPIDVTPAGWLENAVCRQTGGGEPGVRVSRASRDARSAWVEFSARPAPAAPPDPAARPDLPFEDWERGTYAGWTPTGDAFGARPRHVSDIAGYQGNLNQQGEWTANSHESRGGEDVIAADAHIGTLTSREFQIERRHISFRIGGGRHPGRTCLNLLIDGAVVRTATGGNSNRMRFDHFDVAEFEGRLARLQLMDGVSGGWGHVGCDDIVQTDRPRREQYVMERAPDHGTMSLGVLGGIDETDALPAGPGSFPAGLDALDAGANRGGGGGEEVAAALDAPASVAWVRRRSFTLDPGASREVVFILSWCFPNPDRDQLAFLTDARTLRRWYATRFADAGSVREFMVEGLDALTAATRLWRDTWYDSTLPCWFLDRAFANVSTAATATCWRFDNGRFYGWEGTYCCAGTCTHVWQYAQGLARVFPGLERSTREMVDFGLAFRGDSGQIDYRAEAARDLAVDGQCGTILRAYREHQTSGDDRFLRAVWPRVKKAIEHMLARDADEDGILDGPQYNTLDTTWYGQIAWLSSLYLAAVKAGSAMASEMGDGDFARRCEAIAGRGSTSMVDRLFNGEYFVHLTDPDRPDANSTGQGCHIDQLLGQSWAHQVGLGRVVPLEHSQAALRSLYRYSFAPDIGPYRAHAEQTIKGGRWYAMPGEGGLLMCTWPKGGSESATGRSGDAWAAGYFNECMSGFEHQVAAHMIAEGLVVEGLAITRMIHDRYHAARRNPWNEVECSNHYARAMASFGSFVTICGFEHHGPKGHIGFSPRLHADDFRAPFLAGTAWGQFRQKRSEGSLQAAIEVRHGSLALRSLTLEAPGARRATASTDGRAIPCRLRTDGPRATIEFDERTDVQAGSTVRVTAE